MNDKSMRLLEIREDLNMSGTAFAECLGVSFRTLKKFEDGEKEVPKAILKLAELIAEKEQEHKASKRPV